MGIDQAGHHHGIARFVNRHPARNIVEFGDRSNNPPANVNGRGTLGAMDHDTPPANNQIRNRSVCVR
jgi:hypothetical protein